LEKYDFSEEIQSRINSIIEEIAEREIIKIPITREIVRGTSIITQEDDQIKEFKLQEFSFVVLENREDIQNMDLFSIRQEIFHKTDLLITEKKKNIYSVINSIPETKVPTIVDSYISILRELKLHKDKEMFIMANPKTVVKLIREVMSSKENQIKVRRALAELEDE
jgi:hypothetical protein